MKEYLIVELGVDQYAVVIDSLCHNGIEYFLTSKIINSNMDISDDFDIQIYDDKSNTLLLVSDDSIDAEIRRLFDERLEESLQEYRIMQNIDSNEFIRLKVLGVDNALYKLDYNGDLIEKYLHFYDCVNPKINDTIYISKKLIDEKVLSYGYIDSLNNLSSGELMLVVSNGDRLFYKRYYG